MFGSAGCGTSKARDGRRTTEPSAGTDYAGEGGAFESRALVRDWSEGFPMSACTESLRGLVFGFGGFFRMSIRFDLAGRLILSTENVKI